MTDFSVVRQPSRPMSCLTFGFFRCPPTVWPNVQHSLSDFMCQPHRQNDVRSPAYYYMQSSCCRQEIFFILSVPELQPRLPLHISSMPVSTVFGMELHKNGQEISISRPSSSPAPSPAADPSSRYPPACHTASCPLPGRPPPSLSFP